jgi:hypothetical protein
MPEQNSPQQPLRWPQEPYSAQAPAPVGYQQPSPAGRQSRAGKSSNRGFKIFGATIYSVAVLLIGVTIGHASARPGTPAAASTPGLTVTGSPSAASSAPAAQPTRPAATTSHLLLTFSGSGIRNSAPFNVGGGPLTVTYSFNCSSFGGSGNFQADLYYGNQASLNSDDLSVANALARSGHQTTTVYPQYPGKEYYLSVNSECSWNVKVTGQ